MHFSKRLFTLFFVSISFLGFSQIQVSNGPDLNTDGDINFNRIIGGDNEHFFVYRVRSKGFGTDYYLEKYSKKTLQREFIKVIPIPDQAATDILDVKYAQNNICIFYKIYNRKTDQKSLVLQNMSTNGDISPDLKEIITVTAERSQYAGFRVVSNDDTTKFLIATEYKKEKNDSYKINLLLMDAVNIKKLWDKELVCKYNSAPMDVISYKIDTLNNVYFLFTTPGKQIGSRRTLTNTYVGVLKSSETQIQVSELPIAKDYAVSDVEFIKNGDQLACAGFYKDIIERQGRDLIDVGVFYYTFDFSNGALLSSTAKLFDQSLLDRITYRRQQPGFFDYKIDYIKTIGNDVYIIGEQYSEEYVYYYNPSTRTTSSYWMYDYKDILVAKLSGKQNVEWVKNIPFRYSMRMNSPHIFMQYFAFATDSTLYLFYDENHKNFRDFTLENYEPREVKYYGSIHGSNFVSTHIDLPTGKMVHEVVFRNEDYCFTPIQENNLQFIPANNTQVFVPDDKKQIIIYTEDRGAERFSKLKLK
jgi:hypothetical protein